METDVFKALSDTNRLRIVGMLRGGELCACRILEELEISQPTLSHHMSILVKCGLVNVRKEGLWSHYSLNPETLAEIRDYFDDLGAPAGRVSIS